MRCLLFTRAFKEIDQSHPKAWRFIDMDSGNKPDLAAQSRMSELTHGRLPRVIDSGNRYHYGDIHWNNDSDGPGGLSEETHAQYLKQFAADFESSVCELIDRQVTTSHQIPKNPLYTESLEHAHTCMKKCERFVGRHDILDEVELYMEDQSRQPLVIYGGSGCGKTSVLAMGAKMVGLYSAFIYMHTHTHTHAHTHKHIYIYIYIYIYICGGKT